MSFNERKVMCEGTLKKVNDQGSCKETIIFALLPTLIYCAIDGHFQPFKVVKYKPMLNKIFIDNLDYCSEWEYGPTRHRHYGWYVLHKINDRPRSAYMDKKKNSKPDKSKITYYFQNK